MIAEEASSLSNGMDALLGQIDAIAESITAQAATDSERLGDELVGIGEGVLETWLTAKGLAPTHDRVEEFRLLALHRQGARGDPSFNACRESCRELIYQTNCARAAETRKEAIQHLRLASMVARHLILFISGKLIEAGLGDFCCSSRPLRLSGTQVTAQERHE
jgi:hypothetical protein